MPNDPAARVEILRGPGRILPGLEFDVAPRPHLALNARHPVSTEGILVVDSSLKLSTALPKPQ
jgi:hypothetical protein